MPVSKPLFEGARYSVCAWLDEEGRFCTHGIPKLKPKRFNREMEKAQEIRELYLLEYASDGGGYVN